MKDLNNIHSNNNTPAKILEISLYSPVNAYDEPVSYQTCWVVNWLEHQIPHPGAPDYQIQGNQALIQLGHSPRALRIVP